MTHWHATWRSFICDMSHSYKTSYVWDLIQSYVTWLMHMWTHSYMTWLFHMWHGSFICDMTYQQWANTTTSQVNIVKWVTFLNESHCYDSFICHIPHTYVTWLIICDMTYRQRACKSTSQVNIVMIHSLIWLYMTYLLTLTNCSCSGVRCRSNVYRNLKRKLISTRRITGVCGNVCCIVCCSACCSVCCNACCSVGCSVCCWVLAPFYWAC